MGEIPLLSARSIAIAASLVFTTCALAAIPLAAFGEDTPNAGGPTPEVAALLQLRAEVADVNTQALEQAPPAVGNTCRATLEVDGIGDTCVAPGGLLRIQQADGRSHTIHGVDAPPVGQSAFAPGTQRAVNGASTKDITCVASNQPHYTLVYARPGNVASRFATVAPLLRAETYKVSAFIDSESRSVDPSAGRRLPMRCDGGTEPVVLQAAITGLSSGTATFANIVDGLRAQGYQFNGDGAGNERYIVYYDSPSPTGAAGTGHVFTSDSSAGAGNQNNKGGLYAIEYKYENGGGVPHWEVLIHEVMHTMGAVVNAAPHATGSPTVASGGHCNDGQDILCYSDGGPRSSYNANVCTTKVLDCNRDDYFNPAPAAGSYLATNWNAAADYNAYLADYSGGLLVGENPEQTREINSGGPSASDVQGLKQSGASSSAVGVTWRRAPSTAAYVVKRRMPGGTWQSVVTTTRTAAAVPRLAPNRTYEISVARRSLSGQVGTPAVITVASSRSADRRKPTRPGRVVARQQSGTITFTWGDSRDNVGVQSFELQQLTSNRRAKTMGRTPNTSLTIRTSGLRSGTSVRFQVVARDAAGNASRARTVNVRVAHPRSRSSRTLRARATATTTSSVTLSWSSSRTDVRYARYVVSQKIGHRWTQVGAALAGRHNSVRIINLRAHTKYQFRVQGRDSAGNLSTPSAPVHARTR